MKIIYNKILPPKPNQSMMLFGTILAREKFKPISIVLINHEEIHKAQAKDVGGYIPFYILYLYYSLKLKSYKKNPFEIEAYKNMRNLDYLKTRKKDEWEKYK